MTPRQTEALLCVVDWLDREGRAPTYGELAEELVCARVTAFEIVGRLIDQLYLRKEPNLTCSLELTARGRRWVTDRDPLHRLRKAWETASSAERRVFLEEVGRV